MPPIRFFLPNKVPADMPTSPDVYWPDYAPYMRSGVYAWTVQTFQRLRDSGFPCEMVSQMPDDGILVAHRKSVGRDFVPPPGMLFVCLRADATFHPFAHLHVVLNRLALSPWYPSVYLPHWPQVGLIPRDPVRGATFENAAFFGDPGCIAGEMKGAAWESLLRELGLQWHFVGPDKWHDFRTVDLLVAVRGFDRHRHANKPPTKLFNAWHAGVPAILGRESAYQAERRGPLDYLEAGSFADVVDGLRRLKTDPALRAKIVANGRERAQECTPAAITTRWQEFFEGTAVPAYEKWKTAGAGKRTAFRWNGLAKKAVEDLRSRLGR